MEATTTLSRQFKNCTKLTKTKTAKEIQYKAASSPYKEKSNVFNYQSLESKSSDKINKIIELQTDFSTKEDWTEYNQLQEQINYQNQLINDQLFDPFLYFGCSYIKDYMFYKSNPRLEIVFKENSHNTFLKESKLTSSTENFKANDKSQKLIAKNSSTKNLKKTRECKNNSSSIKLTASNLNAFLQNYKSNKNSKKKTHLNSKQPITQEMFKSEYINAYLMNNNPKFYFKNETPKFNTSNTSKCDTGGSTQTPKGSVIASITTLTNGAKQSSINVNESTNSFKGSTKGKGSGSQKHHASLYSTQTPVYRTQGVNSKSCSRSPSPQIPTSMHQWYYQKVGNDQSKSNKVFKSQKDLCKYLLSNPESLSIKSKDKNKKKSKLATCSSNNKTLANKEELTTNLCKSLSNFKNLQAGCTPTEPKINYDSFLEYLNDSMKNITSLTSDVWSRKGSKAQQTDLLKSKKSAEDILLPSDKKYKKLKGNCVANLSINNNDVSDTIK